jgi:hypothetical protein
MFQWYLELQGPCGNSDRCDNVVHLTECTLTWITLNAVVIDGDFVAIIPTSEVVNAQNDRPFSCHFRDLR